MKIDPLLIDNVTYKGQNVIVLASREQNYIIDYYIVFQNGKARWVKKESLQIKEK